jgi:hypothetical protein
MPMTARKGRSGLMETASFYQAFPLDPDPERSTIVTVEQFDRWAVEHQLIPDSVERDTRNSDRNVLRNKINNTAASPAWKREHYDPFHIGVKKHGISYTVRRTADAFAAKATQLPEQMKRILKTKKRALEHIRSSVDMQKLPLTVQLNILQLDQEIEYYAEQVALSNNQLDKKFRMIQNNLRQLALTPANSGIKAMLAIDEDPLK